MDKSCGLEVSSRQTDWCERMHVDCEFLDHRQRSYRRRWIQSKHSGFSKQYSTVKKFGENIKRGCKLLIILSFLFYHFICLPCFLVNTVKYKTSKNHSLTTAVFVGLGVSVCSFLHFS